MNVRNCSLSSATKTVTLFPSDTGIRLLSPCRKRASDGGLGVGGGGLRRLGRQQQREARAFSRCAFHRDFSFVQVHITFDQVQSDTAAGIHGMALCAFALVETHENVFRSSAGMPIPVSLTVMRMPLGPSPAGEFSCHPACTVMKPPSG